MPTKRLKTSTFFICSLCLLLLVLISCNRTTDSNQPIQNTTTTDLSTDTLSTTNTDDVNKWLIPLISEYLQDDGTTVPSQPSLTVLKTGTGSGNVSSTPAGINCGATCSSTYDADTIVTLTAVADSGSSFTSWSGCTSTNNATCTVTVNDSTNVTATFTLTPTTLSYQGFYITQAAQNFNNTAALAENRKSYARLFLTQSGSEHTAIDADLHMYSGTTYLGKIDLAGPSTAPTSYSEGDLTSSYNAIVPAAWIKTDTNYYISVSSSGNSNVIREPVTNTLSQNVKAAPPLEVVWVPIVYNGQTPSMTATAREALLKSTREYWPIVDINQTVRASYTFNQELEGQNPGPGWQTLLSEINTLKNLDGAADNVYYHAIVDNNAFASRSGIYGIAYRPGDAAVSREHTETIAHEWGHNWNRRHVAGCNNPSNPDPSYPHSGGSIGVWGINVFDDSLALKSPNTWRDTMTYCDVDWSSDYNYDAIANYRSTGANIIDNRVKQLILMVGGSISPTGQATLNPSFSFEALPDLPNFGEYTVQLISNSDTVLAELNFDSMEIDHSNERHFFVNVPITQTLLSSLATVRILDSDGNVIAERSSSELQTQQAANQPIDAPLVSVTQTGSTVTLNWDATTYPRIIVKSNQTTVTISESGSVEIDASSLSNSLEVLLSNGVISTSVTVDIGN